MYLTFGVTAPVLVNLYGVEEAVDQIKQSAMDSSTMNYNLGIVYFMARDFDKARELYLKSGYRDLDWGLLLMKDGLRDSSVSVLERSIEYRLGFHENFGTWHLFDISRAYGALGDLENFMKYARLSFELGWHEVYYLDNDPLLDRIRDTPEFKLIRSEFDVINRRLIKEVAEAVKNPEEIL